MRLADFDYHLPREQIAQEPIKPRDHSRLLVLAKKTGKIEHRHFYNLTDYLRPGDVLVMNNSKVIPARLIGRKKETNGKIEVFLLASVNSRLTSEKIEADSIWQCLVGGKGGKVGLEINFSLGLEAKIMENNHDGTWMVRFNKQNRAFMAIVKKIGQIPLPPYIDSASNEKIKKKEYQTVYADNKKSGSVAAPTAGLHFTPRLLKELTNKGVIMKYITLHVGLGTFAPVKEDDFTKHQMHREYVEVKARVIKEILKAKQTERRIIAVGTTTVRTLEAMAEEFLNAEDKNLKIKNYSNWVNIFIYPPYRFKLIDGMVTNFHLPKSTLLMLVSALAGKKNIDLAYQEAIKENYRFYSYGDAMLII